MDKCLITGDDLPADTPLEHTLLRSLGGRIRSRRVASKRLNHGTSQFDDMLFDPYRSMFNYLAPLLSAEHQPGKILVTIKGEKGKYFQRPGSVLEMVGTRVTGYDENGRPNAVEAVNEETAKKVIESLGWNGEVRMSRVPITTQEHMNHGGMALHWKMEVSALKCILLSFDELLHGTGRQFTRDPSVAPTIRLLERAIFEPGFDEKELYDLILGIDNSLLEIIRAARRSIPEPVTEFENVIIATANPTYQTLDVGWLIADTDFFRFRVTDKWTGTGFTVIAGSGVLNGTKSFGPEFLVKPLPIGMPSLTRSWFERDTSQAVLKQAVRDLIDGRHEAAARAFLLAELKNDSVLVDHLLGNAEKIFMNSGDPNVSLLQAVEGRVARIYKRSVPDAELSKELESLRANLSHAMRSESFSFADPKRLEFDEGVWLTYYRNVLVALSTKFGPPRVTWSEKIQGEISAGGSKIEVRDE